MPELPDVEGFRRNLARTIPGRRVQGVHVADAGVVRNVSPQALGRVLHGRRLREPSRHGKWLMLGTDGPTVLVHAGMTGGIEWAPDGQDRQRDERVVLKLDEGEIRYRDLRKLRGVWLAREGEAIEAVTGPLGPDALYVDRDELAESLRAVRRGLKAALLDQELVAGLGNLLVDEILWRAGLSPRRRTDELSDAELGRLYTALRRVLRTSVQAGRVPPRRGWITGARDDDEPRCPRAHGALSKATVAGRSTVWCPRCQPDR